METAEDFSLADVPLLSALDEVVAVWVWAESVAVLIGFASACVEALNARAMAVASIVLFMIGLRKLSMVDLPINNADLAICQALRHHYATSVP